MLFQAHWVGLLFLGATLMACRGNVPPQPGLPGSGSTGGTGAPANQSATPTPVSVAFTPTVNQVFSVVLPSSGDGGYQWHLQEGADARVVKLKGQRTGTLPTNAAPGRFADEIFDFDALAAGKTTLVFINYRPWEGPAQAVETRRYEVNVK